MNKIATAVRKNDLNVDDHTLSCTRNLRNRLLKEIERCARYGNFSYQFRQRWDVGWMFDDVKSVFEFVIEFCNKYGFDTDAGYQLSQDLKDKDFDKKRGEFFCNIIWGENK